MTWEVRLLLAGFLAALGAGGGWQVRDWQADADQLQRLKADARDAQRRVDNADRSSGAYEGKRADNQARQRVIFREVERVVQTPVYRDRVCLDDAGLRLVAEAVGAGPAAGELAPAVPAAAASR